MAAEDVYLGDWKRLLLGNAPLGFLAEVLLRVVLTYALLLILVRLLGKRMSGQVSNLELAVMMVLGAIVAVPFQIPERGMVPAIVLLLCVLALHQGLTQLGARSPRAEAFTQGRASALLEDGRLLPSELRRAGLSNEQLFAVLRSHSIAHLGELKRIYFEACGEFSLLRAERPQPGLSVQPVSDEALQQRTPRAKNAAVCARCGHVVPLKHRPERCAMCDSDIWGEPVAVAQDHGAEA
jgi:uncharacterized membrane protein YcaP (DUF421 family)